MKKVSLRNQFVKLVSCILVLGSNAFITLGGNDNTSDIILFSSDGTNKLGNKVRVLCRINSDGTEWKQLTSSEQPRVRRSSVSPIGKKIAFLSRYRIHVRDWDKQNDVDITPVPREHFLPSWSPDGKEIAFTTDRNNDAEIYVMNIDGSNSRNLTWSPMSSDMSPSWSPDGKEITFISNRNGKKFELFKMDTNGFNQKMIISLDGDIREPAWGINNKIAFALEKGGVSNLYMVDPDGKNLIQLTNTKSWNGQPAWDSEGKRLAFSSTRSGNANIWIMDIVDKKCKNVTNKTDKDSFFPCWVPKQISDKPITVTKANVSAIDLPRPRMLFRKKDISGIKKHLEQEPYASSWKKFLARCDNLLNPASHQHKNVVKSFDEIKNKANISLYNRAPWINAVFELAFAYQITGEMKYGKLATEWLVKATQMYSKYHARIQYTYQVSCAYDWLYGLLPPDERQSLTALLCNSAQLYFYGLLQHNLGLGPLSDGNSNIGVFMVADFGPLALTLAGEPGFKADWLAGAIRLTGMCFNNWIGDSGGCREGFSYFAAPIRQIMPFLVSLKINNLAPHVFDSNLKKVSRWIAISAAHGMTETVNLGDCDSFGLWIPSGLRMLYEKDDLMNILWDKVPRAKNPQPLVNELLWWRPSKVNTRKIPDLPKITYFPNQTYVVMRSGYGKDDPMMTLCNPMKPGHTHDECGSVLLYGYGTRFLVDPGQGMSKAQLHNNILINGRGRGRGTDLSETVLQVIADNDLGGIACADLKEAFSSKADGYLDYKIPSGWLPIEYGSRYLAMVDRPKDGIPPYFVIYDNVKVNDKDNKYESLFLMDMDKQVKVGDHQFIIESNYNGPWFVPVDKNKVGSVEFTFKVNLPGEYQIWLFIKDPADHFTFTVNGKSAGGGRARGTTTRSKCWQWKRPIAGKKPLKVKLQAGENKLAVSHHGGGIFSRIILCPTDADFYGEGASPKLPKNSLLFGADQGKIIKDLVLKKPEGKLPKALFAFLNPVTLTIKEKQRKYRTRFFSQQLVILPQVIAERNTVAPRFLTFIYPYREGMEQPKITRSSENGLLCAKIEWKNVTDYILSAPKGETVSNKVFRTDSPLAIVRKNSRNNKISHLSLGEKKLLMNGKPLGK